MKVIAVSRPVTRPLAELAPHLLDEAAATWTLYTEDLIREIYLRDDGGVILILESPDLGAARDTIGRLPLTANGFLEFDIWALAPFSPWGRLQAPGRGA